MTEVEMLRELLQEARDWIGGMPTLDADGNDRFFGTLRLVTKIEGALASGEEACKTEDKT